MHVSSLPGKPDIVLPKHNAVVLVHGCYWHRHPGCRFATTPATNTQFWDEKFAGTVERDSKAEAALKDARWRVFTVWECDLKSRPTEVAEELAWNILRR